MQDSEESRPKHNKPRLGFWTVIALIVGGAIYVTNRIDTYVDNYYKFLNIYNRFLVAADINKDGTTTLAEQEEYLRRHKIPLGSYTIGDYKIIVPFNDSYRPYILDSKNVDEKLNNLESRLFPSSE